jgi:drug/metabolite transporter (DMT)-like permease
MPSQTAAPATAQSHSGLSAAGVAAGGGALLCWTVTPLFVEYLTGSFDLWASNGWRYGLAALMWLPYLVWTLVRRRVPGSVWRRALLPAFFSTVAQIAFVAAFYYTGPAQLTFGLRMQIVATAIGAAILFPAEREVIRRSTFLVGALAVLAGVVGVAAFAPGAVEAVEGEGLVEAALEPTGDSNLFGMFLAAIAGIGYAGYAMSVRKCLAGVSAKLSFSVISLYVGVALLILMLLLSESPASQLAAIDGWQWICVLLSVVFGLAAGHVIYFVAMERLGVAQATGIVQLQPFTVAAASFLIFGELLAPAQLLCGTVAVGGAAMMLYTQHLVARRRRLDARREFDEFPLNEAVALEEAQLASGPDESDGRKAE